MRLGKSDGQHFKPNSAKYQNEDRIASIENQIPRQVTTKIVTDLATDFAVNYEINIDHCFYCRHDDFLGFAEKFVKKV